MKKKILKVLSMFILLSAYGVIKESENVSHLLPYEPHERIVEPNKVKTNKLIRYVSAFSISDLYRSRERILSNRRQYKRETRSDLTGEEVIEEVKPTKVIEIIQVVDEDGNIVANKRVK